MGINRKPVRSHTREFHNRDKYVKMPGPNGVLSRLWRNMLDDLGINKSGKFDQLLNAYLRDGRNGIPNNRKDITSARGNLVKELTKTQMTWKVFMKAMKFLQLTEIELTITATHANGRKTVHGTKIELGGPLDLQEFNTRLEQNEESELTYEPAAFEQYAKHEDDPSQHSSNSSRQISTVANTGDDSSGNQTTTESSS